MFKDMSDAELVNLYREKVADQTLHRPYVKHGTLTYGDVLHGEMVRRFVERHITTCDFCKRDTIFTDTFGYGSRYDGHKICADCLGKHIDPVLDTLYDQQ